MVKHSRGYKSRTRKLLRKKPRERGLFPLSRLLLKYEVGDRVAIIIDPSVHRGMPHRRFHGRIGVIAGVRGKSYIVEVMLGNKKKTLIVRPEHLRLFSTNLR